MQGNMITLADLPLPLKNQPPCYTAAAVAPIREVQTDAEKAAIVGALKRTGNNKARAAALLGIHRTLLYKKMKKHGIPLAPAG
jgi:transcriptional regulator with PAS, ATPase and Fis domain